LFDVETLGGYFVAIKHGCVTVAFSYTSAPTTSIHRNLLKTLNVIVPLISQAKHNRKIKGREYQLQAKIGRHYYCISNCMGFNSPK